MKLHVLTVGLSLLLGCVPAPAADSPALAPPERSIHVGALPLLFADDSGVARSQGVIRTIHAARTREQPVMEPKLPWEGSRVYVYGSVVQDPATQHFRMWYLGHPGEDAQGRKIKVPGFRTGKSDMVMYATSADGLKWERPELGLHSFQGSKANNLVFDMHSPSVLFDPGDPDPARRYKMLGSITGAYYAGISPDGLQWSRYPDDKPILKASDNISLAQDPFTREYLAYHRRPSVKYGRCVYLSRSADFKTWTEPEATFHADEEDDAGWMRMEGARTEVNNLSVFPHAGGFIGLPTIFRVLGPNRDAAAMKPGQSATDGIVEVQLITSADGRQWQRTRPRISVIPRGEPGRFDAGTILGVSSTCVHAGDETWVYYTALTTSHGAPIPPKRNAIGRAEWRLHGFASLDSGEYGRVETKPLHLDGGTLVVNANAAGGEVRAALLEADGSPIVGYAIEDCEPLTANTTHHQMRWKTQGPKVPDDRPVRVVLQMRQARLYSLSSSQGPRFVIPPSGGD